MAKRKKSRETDSIDRSKSNFTLFLLLIYTYVDVYYAMPNIYHDYPQFVLSTT